MNIFLLHLSYNFFCSSLFSKRKSLFSFLGDWFSSNHFVFKPFKFFTRVLRISWIFFAGNLLILSLMLSVWWCFENQFLKCFIGSKLVIIMTASFFLFTLDIYFFSISSFFSDFIFNILFFLIPNKFSLFHN